MPTEAIRRRVAHDAGAMFDLVADIERYPEFLPGCTGLRIVSRETNPAGQRIVAEMRVGYRMISERFTCRVRLDREALAIDVDFVDGPFRRLANHWRFRQLDGEACEVDFRIDFELRSRQLGFLVAALFDRVFMRFVDAFEARADALRAQKIKMPQEPA